MNKLQDDKSFCMTQCNSQLDQNYWESKWQNRKTGWDIGYASSAITEYMSQYRNKSSGILIPGCGNAHEAKYLVENGFTNITLIDIAPTAVATLKERFVDTPQVNVLLEDFFHHKGNYDLIIEQTFFCAIPPDRREEYAKKTASLLNENGQIIGVLFDQTFEKQGPPFGGCVGEYKPIFEPHFTIMKMEDCYNSIPQRVSSEVFINLIKK